MRSENPTNRVLQLLCYAHGFMPIADSGIRYVDLGVIVAYLIGITWFGSRFKESQKSLKDYFSAEETPRGGRSDSPSYPPKPPR